MADVIVYEILECLSFFGLIALAVESCSVLETKQRLACVLGLLLFIEDLLQVENLWLDAGLRILVIAGVVQAVLVTHYHPARLNWLFFETS